MSRHTLLTIVLLLATTLTLVAREGESSGATGRRVLSDRKTPLMLSTNLFDWCDFATLNLEVGVPVAQKWSLHAGVKYNPWKFNSSKGNYQTTYNQQKSFSLGVRFWPWYVNSGWWVCGKVQYTDYAITGVWRPALDTGKALGVGFSAGYSLMINKHLNLDFGAGFWTGALLEHTLYRSVEMMEVRESGKKGFIAINDITIGIQYLF